MPGGVVKLLGVYQGVLTGKLRFIFPSPLARFVMRRLGIQNSISAYYYSQAHVFANRGEYDRSIRACQASIAVRPDNIAAYEVLAQVLTHIQQYEEAFRTCADALVVKSDSDAISASLRQLLPLVRHSDQPEKVIEMLQNCLAVSPARGDVLLLLIEMLLHSYRYVEAVQACQRILDVDPEFFPAAETIRSLLKDPAARQALASINVPALPALSDEYDWLVASNVTETLLAVMRKFYTKLGVDPQIVPLVQGLERSRRKLAAAKPIAEQSPAQSTLVSFERAWMQYRAGQIRKALTTFESIINDSTARERAAHNPSLREAVVRSGEILGRHHDKLGNVEKAIEIYRNILSVEADSLVARRLIVLLSRSGRLAEAAEFAETAIVSRPNLFRHVPPNAHIVALKEELFVKPEGA